MATRVQKQINSWFWWGVGGILVGPLVAGAMYVSGHGWAFFVTVALSLAGWPAVLVGVVGKGVELGVRAANDE